MLAVLEVCFGWILPSISILSHYLFVTEHEEQIEKHSNRKHKHVG